MSSEERKASDAAAYQRNAEAKKSQKREYYQANAEACRERRRAEYQSNPEKIRARVAEYRRANPSKILEAGKRHRALKLGAPVRDFTGEQWEAIKVAYGHRCAYCGKKSKALTRDHVVPLSMGGYHTASNIVPACRPCNSSKSTRDPMPHQKHLLVGEFTWLSNEVAAAEQAALGLRSEVAHLTRKLDDLQAEYSRLAGDFIALSNKQVAAESGVTPDARRN